MTTALIRSLNQTRALYDSAYRSGTRIKKVGASFFDVGAGAQASIFGQSSDYSQQKNRYNSYRGWVYSAINALAKAGAAKQVNLGTTTKKTDNKPGKTKSFILNRMTPEARMKAAEEEYEVIYDHPFLKALETPNAIQGRWQFVYSFIANLGLTGWSFIVADKVEKEGYQFYSVPTTWVRPIHEKGPYSEFKIVNPNKPDIEDNSPPLGRDRVSFAYIPNPANMFKALAPVQSQDIAIKIDQDIQTSQRVFFQKGVFPSLVLTMGTNPMPDVAKGQFRPRLTESQKRQIRLAIKKEMQGVSNYGNPAIIDGLIESIDRLSSNSNEMGWEKSDKINRTRILSALGVHPFILGEEVAGSYAQSYNVKEIFYDNVNTYLDMLGSCMSHFAGVLTGDEDLLVWWTPCKAVDPAQESMQWAQARQRDDVTQNEWRAYMDLPPDDDKNQNVVGKNGKDIIAVAAQVKGGQLTPEQGQAILVGFGLPDDIAKKIAGDGPSKEDLERQQQMQQQLMGQQGEEKEEKEEKEKPGKKKPPEEQIVEDAEKALELMRRPLVIDVKEIDAQANAIYKNCGIGSGGFQPGNTCARGGGTKVTSAGEMLTAAYRGEDKVWRTYDGKKAPDHVQKLAIPPAWKDVHVNLNPNGMVMATGTDAKGRGQTRYSANHTMRAAADKFARVSELRSKRKEIFKEIETDLKSPDRKMREDALCCKLIMITGMRPGSESDTGADYKSYGATTLEGRHVVSNPDGTAILRFVPGKKKGQEIEMQVTDKRLARQLVSKAKKAGPEGRLFDTTASRVSAYSKSKDGKGFKTKDHRTALGTETAISVIKSMPKPKTKKEYKSQVKAVSTAVSDLLGNTPSIAFKSYIDPQVWVPWTKSAKIK